jgi:hypothetical protein
MKLTIPNCPYCRNPAAYIVETLYAHSAIGLNDDGTFGYVGDSDMLWDTQQPLVDEETGLLWVRCGGVTPHEWATEITYEDEEEG